jgi:hypothetical protein
MISFNLVPGMESEISNQFIQGMLDRMCVSRFKYGPVKEAYPHKVSAISSLETRIALYKQTGNTEYLMDAANFAMIEFMLPGHPKAHFKPTDSNESPGRVWHGEVDSSQRSNKGED